MGSGQQTTCIRRGSLSMRMGTSLVVAVKEVTTPRKVMSVW